MPYRRLIYSSARAGSRYWRGVNGQAKAMARRTRQLHGRSRAADDNLNRYELYHGVGGADPDLSAAPATTSPTLPITYTLTANTENRVVIRRRNVHGLVSLNTSPLVFILNASGQVVTHPPAGPDDGSVALAALVSGFVQVRATYALAGLPLSSGGQYLGRAKQWLLYVRDDGTDPDPAIDAPAVIKMTGQRSGYATLEHALGPYADGADVRVLVRTRRLSDNQDSTNTDIHTINAVLSTGLSIQWGHHGPSLHGNSSGPGLGTGLEVMS